jgi:N-acetylglucosaminyldiphosphoundecaprenol N-acetyl-beta-D-mannosaminyltransferase
MENKQKMFGIPLTNAEDNEILEYIFQGLKSRKKLFITTPNPEIIMYALKHPAYKEILNRADIALPDGVGVFIAAGLLGQRLKQRIPGVDFIDLLCKNSVRNPVSMGFLGGGPGVAQRASERLKKKYPYLRISFARAEWDTSLDQTLTKPVDIVFVAFGFPKQEEWIYHHLNKLPIRAAMGVGGAFDYICGDVVRCPYLIRAMGFEWLFRLIVQPWRIKRQLVLLEFSLLVCREGLKRMGSS